MKDEVQEIREAMQDAAAEVQAEQGTGISPVVTSVDMRTPKRTPAPRQQEKRSVDTERLDRLFDETERKMDTLEENQRVDHMRNASVDRMDKELQEMGWI